VNDRKRALISGASSGIGKATVHRFAAEGYDVCLTARRGHLLKEIMENLPAGNHLVCPGDYADPQAAERVRATTLEEWEKMDVLINCAGLCEPLTLPGRRSP